MKSRELGGPPPVVWCCPSSEGRGGGSSPNASKEQVPESLSATRRFNNKNNILTGKEIVSSSGLRSWCCKISTFSFIYC